MSKSLNQVLEVIYGAVLKTQNLFLIQFWSKKKICDSNLGKYDDYAVYIKGPYCTFQYDFW